MASEEQRNARRDFLRTGIAVVIGLRLGGCSVFAKKVTPDLTTGAEGGIVRIPVAEVPWVRGGHGTFAVQVEGLADKILLYREPGGALVAMNMTCTHLGCDVEYENAVGHVVCPCHGSEFSNSGAVLKGPAKEPLRTWPISVEGDEVRVRIR